MPITPDLVRSFGFSLDGVIPPERRKHLLRCIHLQLAAMGLSPDMSADAETMAVASGFLARYRQKARLLEDYRCPADRRIEEFLAKHLADLKLGFAPRLPGQTFVLDQHGVAREISLPLGEDNYVSPLVSSYRVRNGVLHNPKSDRRTTKGTFHVAEGGLPIPDDKIAVPRPVFAEVLRRAVAPPKELMVLPFTARWKKPAEVFVSLLLRPLVCPAVPGASSAKHMEVRFFAPGSLVSNLDFVESIFGNAGDPMLPDNDAALDIEAWTGHTGCVILAPHLIEATKKDLGLPHIDKATPRQKRDGMCWTKPEEKYNGGEAFKLTCRTEDGVIITLIADNYFGYCKKEVKTQISFAANLFGNAEEEHAGGAIVFPSYALGDEFRPQDKFSNGRTFAQVAKDYAAWMDVQPSGYGVDKKYPNVIYIAEDATLNVRTLQVSWTKDGVPQSLPLLMDHIYVTPSGQKLFVNKHPGSGRFRLVVTAGEGTLCHKPCTVSGGGKSEISKSLDDYMIYGPVYVGDLQKDLDQVERLLKKDYATRWKNGKEPQDYSKMPSRPLLGDARSLGSVIKLLTPAPDYTDEFNQWLETIPSDILSLLLLIKRLHRPEWGDNWREHFTVDVINGEPGHELKVDDRKAAGVYLRVGLLENQTWRTFRLRQDFFPAQKVQLEDDITASTVVPASWLADQKIPNGRSVKLVRNCEYRLFQRPDDAIHPGFDKQAESDIARHDNFLSNYEPLSPEQSEGIARKIAFFDRFTPPMKRMVSEGAKQQGGHLVCSANPRVINGKPSKNPRYLQTRLDLLHPLPAYVAEMGLRLARVIPADKPVVSAVDSVLFGRRNNPPEHGVRGLAVFNPIHYQELPELFMEFICSLTGKSPSTTGAGSEGALTKGPFNALLPIIDLNTALVSYILTGLGGFSTAAGCVGPKSRVDHDLSLMIPELWCRMRPEQRDPKYLIENQYLEKLNDFEHNGKKVLASRLGYRITYNFVRAFFGRLFANPNRVFDTAMLKPETQDIEVYVDGILNISEAQQRVAKHYFEDGSVELACPPLRALLHIMADGNYEGRGAADPQIRRMFTREYLLKSDWYTARLARKQERDRALWQRHVASLADFIADESNTEYVQENGLRAQLDFARQQLDYVSSPQYVGKIVGTVGADPMKAVPS